MASRSISESEDASFDEKLIKLSEVKAFFTCSICATLLQGTSTTVCGHRYCAHCLQNWFERKRECPLCKISLRNKTEIKDHQFDDLLRTIKEKAVNEADAGARYVLESSNGSQVSNPIDHKMAEVLCCLLPQKDRDMKEMVEKLIAEKDKSLRDLKEREIPYRDQQIQFLLGQTKKLEEEAKQLKALPEKLEKCQKNEVKFTEEKHKLEEKVQRLTGELATLKTMEVTQQQKEKELYGKLQHQMVETQSLKMSLDQQTKAAENAETLKRTVKQLEKSLQQKTCEASHYQGFVPYKDLYEQRNQEANVIQQHLEQKDALIHSLQMRIESMNETISAQNKQIKETPLSLKDAEARYQRQLLEMQKSLEKFYENKSEVDTALYKKHADELARDLADERSSRLEEIQRMHDENMKLRRKVGELQSIGTHQNAEERCEELEQSLRYFKNKVHNLEQQLTYNHNRSNSNSP
ncbi:uncharacterized protein LOC111122148 isoform X1 [Crassostrea virginica]